MRGEPLGRSSLADLLATQRRTPPQAPKIEENEGPDAAPGLMPSPA